MTDRDVIEREIRDYLSADVDSVTFSNHLFQQQTGLFARLGQAVQNRRAVVNSELWKLAQSRLRDLERVDSAHFRDAVRSTNDPRRIDTKVAPV